jgi:hypothetical protein
MESLTEFPPEIGQDVTGLLYLGQLTKEVHWAGHSFLLRTLRLHEELAVGLVTKKYEETFTLGKAIAVATVGDALEEVDGTSFAPPLGPDIEVSIEHKFNQASKYFWPVVQKLYEEYLEIQKRQINAFDALESKS